MTELETAKMSERGQIIIPKDIRKFIGAEESTIFTVLPLDNETIVMRKLDKNKILKEFGSIRKRLKGTFSAREINEEIHKSRKK